MEWFFYSLIIYLSVILVHGFYRVGLELGEESARRQPREYIVRTISFEAERVNACVRVANEDIYQCAIPTELLFKRAEREVEQQIFQFIRKRIRLWREEPDYLHATDVRGELIVGVQR